MIRIGTSVRPASMVWADREREQWRQRPGRPELDPRPIADRRARRARGSWRTARSAGMVTRGPGSLNRGSSKHGIRLRASAGDRSVTAIGPTSTLRSGVLAHGAIADLDPVRPGVSASTASPISSPWPSVCSVAGSAIAGRAAVAGGVVAALAMRGRSR
jgi:hypothetical protein